jgi:hypothetical protein
LNNSSSEYFFGEREVVIVEYCACTARSSPLFCERQESNGWPVSNSETLSSLVPIEKNFRQRSSHFSLSASFAGRVFRMHSCGPRSGPLFRYKWRSQFATLSDQI